MLVQLIKNIINSIFKNKRECLFNYNVGMYAEFKGIFGVKAKIIKVFKNGNCQLEEPLLYYFEESCKRVFELAKIDTLFFKNAKFDTSGNVILSKKIQDELPNRYWGLSGIKRIMSKGENCPCCKKVYEFLEEGQICDQCKREKLKKEIDEYWNGE